MTELGYEPCLSYSKDNALLFFFFSAMPWGLLDLSFPTWDWTQATAVKEPRANHLDCQGIPTKTIFLITVVFLPSSSTYGKTETQRREGTFLSHTTKEQWSWNRSPSKTSPVSHSPSSLLPTSPQPLPSLPFCVCSLWACVWWYESLKRLDSFPWPYGSILERKHSRAVLRPHRAVWD